MAWSYIAQRAITGEFLDWDLPLEIAGVEWQLSGPGSLKATISPDVGGLRASDGGLLLEEWGTLIHAEHDGLIRWSGILITSNFNGENWELEAAGYGTYPHAVTWEGDYSAIGIDPTYAIRLIWEHIQSFPDGNLGVVVTGATDTGVRMGTPAPVWPGPTTPVVWLQSYIDAHPESTEKRPAAIEIRDRIASGQPIAEDWTWDGCSALVSEYNDELVSDYNSAQSPSTEEAKPYELVWYESTNCGDEIDDLAKLAPLDWVENHYWAPDHESIIHEINLAFPRAGRRRDDLVFTQGDNVTNVVTIESNGDEFANNIVGLGAGEGRAMVRRETSLRDGRLRRVHVLADKTVSDLARMDALIAEELNYRRAAVRVESIDVIDHPNAPIGSWSLGDDVMVRAELPWLGEINVWCRVTGWSLTGENTATLTLVRSDLYRYGGAPVDPA